MADKKELLQVMKVIKEHCKYLYADCAECKLENKCNENFENIPMYWDLEDGESND